MSQFVAILQRAVAVSSAALVVALIVLLPGTAGAAVRLASQNPPQNCDQGHLDYLHLRIRNLNRCRRAENLGRLQLPSNFRHLKAAERLLVLMNLARVNRGLPPIVGLSDSLNAIARHGARAQADPAFPARGFTGGGALWSFGFRLAGAQLGWMYDDGWGRNATNSACSSPYASGCWVHRDIILMSSSQRLVAGGAVRKVRIPGMKAGHSYAFEILAGYSTRHLTFSWRRELKYFKVRPGRDPLTAG